MKTLPTALQCDSFLVLLLGIHVLECKMLTVSHVRIIEMRMEYVDGGQRGRESTKVWNSDEIINVKCRPLASIMMEVVENEGYCLYNQWMSWHFTVDGFAAFTYVPFQFHTDQYNQNRQTGSRTDEQTVSTGTNPRNTIAICNRMQKSSWNDRSINNNRCTNHKTIQSNKSYWIAHVNDVR